MSQLFHPSINIISRSVILGIVIVLIGGAGLAYLYFRSPFVTEVGIAQTQPVPFSHQLHVGGVGLDCRYCHTSVEESNFAGIPPTETCMGCHGHFSTDDPVLEPVRASAQNNQPLAWVRVHNLADFVYFNHAIHVKKGVGCETCHGRVDQMPLTAKAETLQMDWCLECHRATERFLRPSDQVFTLGWQPPADQITLGRQLVADQKCDS
ncbi:MAG: cytochrome c3 family protein [Chloroflexi bacterium]|nr:cytochrome c3 family protein [Chloroflexota bacterium]